MFSLLLDKNNTFLLSFGREVLLEIKDLLFQHKKERRSIDPTPSRQEGKAGLFLETSGGKLTACFFCKQRRPGARAEEGLLPLPLLFPSLSFPPFSHFLSLSIFKARPRGGTRIESTTRFPRHVRKLGASLSLLPCALTRSCFFLFRTVINANTHYSGSRTSSPRVRLLSKNTVYT